MSEPQVELKNLDKLLFAEDGISKGDVIDYYGKVADYLLPHARGRALTLHRFPDGIDSEGFYQQNRPDYFPPWLKGRRIRRAGSDERIEHVLVNQPADLVYLANQGVIALHGWLSRADKPARPDKLIFDLDPPDGDFAAVRKAARQVCDLFDEAGLPAFAMTTGSRGIHVVAPLVPEADYDRLRETAKQLAAVLASRHPDELTTEQRKNKRRGRLYLDVMRNAWGQTGILPYSLRAIEGAPVATPLERDELGRAALSAQSYTLANLFRRLGQRGDPWAHFQQSAVKLGSVVVPRR